MHLLDLPTSTSKSMHRRDEVTRHELQRTDREPRSAIVKCSTTYREAMSHLMHYYQVAKMPWTECGQHSSGRSWEKMLMPRT